MLIVAIPKSASTSLMKTLGELHRLKALQDFSIKHQDIPQESNVVHTVHSDIRELNRENIDKYCANDAFYKQHIFPSENNLRLLKNKKKVVLLRDSKQILLAYKRGAKQSHNGIPKGFSVALSNKEFLQLADKQGFKADIDFFKSKWEGFSSCENTLIIFYKDYIKNTKKVINDIEYFFELPISKGKIIAIKARYSRTSNLSKKYYRFKQFVKKITKIKNG